LEHAPKDDSGESDFVVAVMKNAAEQLRAYLLESERGNLDKAAF
jgi:tRNA U34 5-carboxymethylaminomethyl modifying GTPase MnmE/TrmE